MSDPSRKERFSSVRFRHYKTFQDFSISLERFNVLVGPNNCGKSTIVGAFRILAEGMRKARAKSPTSVRGPNGRVAGYSIDLGQLPLATENVFFNYDERTAATVRFHVSNGNDLLLFFPESGVCSLICEPKGPPIKSPSGFKLDYPLHVGFVPILGPVEHDERLYLQEAARLALLSQEAARNFRNIWYHYRDGFEDFRSLVQSTWPGMDIQPPEMEREHKTPLLRMFCVEERYQREIFWAGFGFQVWCQMLTHVIKNRNSSLLMIDEPEIYLHSDVQRRLIGILRDLDLDVIIATHSTEIIRECDADDLLIVNKKTRSAKRLHGPAQVNEVFDKLGSQLNPTLTQVAKTRRLIFVEGEDFSIIARFARKLGYDEVADQSDFAVIPAKGFNPRMVRDFVKGVEQSLGTEVLVGVIFDRDYRCDEECVEIAASLKECSEFATIHRRKELENFLLCADALERAVEFRIREKNRRTETNTTLNEKVPDLLDAIADPMRSDVAAQFLSKRHTYKKRKDPRIDEATVLKQDLTRFDQLWRSREDRLAVLPGKCVLADLNTRLQTSYGVTISPTLVISCFEQKRVPKEMLQLVQQIDKFRKMRCGA